ncbi:hypothetical protein GLAREA_12584 [Glarea lozoyensis ATCC 20868]|uniref:Heterokaryon incompatibility domain-containing protein n=1 Tax=Glarea lozoyensis (strain ATCC 20868 / MF5171) TaxID=1116229 RepID=S3DGZ5_GLAL2|nr:uncharacterized protein GLAREA_12584 [Glarea lozoyensis ATCC 20868]EPE31281.1 hypothetical protein GLAREA_12584 [Glarea lozoyensis ATCC 20868]
METSPLLQISSLSTLANDCESCRNRLDRKSIGLQVLSQSAKSGCASCSVLHRVVFEVLDCRFPAWTEIKADLVVAFQANSSLSIILRQSGERKIPSLQFAIYTRYGHPQSASPFVRIGRDCSGPRRDAYSDVCKDWIGNCELSHSRCRKGPTTLPGRILDVGFHEDNLIRLRVFEAPQKGYYTALSHCWGGLIQCRTTKGNYSERLDGISVSSLPQSFQDAVTVTRSLEVRYLWIDALCIIQDDIDDWETISGDMAAIYRNAYLVIGADMSENCHEGFLNSWEPGKYPTGPGKPVAYITDEKATLYWRTLQHEFKPCSVFADRHRRQKIAERVWTFQEHLLSTRMIHFADTELVWECECIVLCECMEIDPKDTPSGNSIDFRGGMDGFRQWLQSSMDNKFSMWSCIVDAVMGKSITYEQDILPALSGIVGEFQRSGAGPYLAGIWLNDYPQSLFWSAGGSGISDQRPVAYRAPTWSWASIKSDRPLCKYSFGWSQHRILKTYAKIIAASCTPKGKDPLGAVTDGFMEVVGPLLQVRCIEFVGGSATLVADSELTSSSLNPIRGFFDLPESRVSSKNVFCLYIGSWKYLYGVFMKVRPRISAHSGLLLIASEGLNDGKYERVGIFVEGLVSTEGLPSGVVETVVTII